MTFLKHGFISSGFLNLSPSEAYREITENNAVILDVREINMTLYKRINATAVINIPYSLLSEKYQIVPHDVPVIVADSVGLHSHEAMVYLLSKGFGNIANLAGGIADWERDGFPLKTEKSEQLDGSCVCQLKPRNKMKNIN